MYNCMQKNRIYRLSVRETMLQLFQGRQNGVIPSATYRCLFWICKVTEQMYTCIEKYAFIT